MRQKQLTRLSLVLGAALLLAVGGSVAYFVATETAHNVVSTGKVNILLNELMDETGALRPFNDLENIEAGATYSKKPYIENHSTEPVWVRAKVSLIKTAGDGTKTPIDDFTSLMTLKNQNSHWLAGENGFYYYDSALPVGGKTEFLFESVKFADTIDDEYQLATYTLTVTAEATQTAHNGTSAFDAVWTENGGA